MTRGFILKGCLSLYLFTAIQLTVFDAWGQSFYTSDRIDFHYFYDSTNYGFLRSRTDNFATLLVKGYVENKLTAYSYSWDEKELKWAPLPKDQWPPSWNAKTTYFQDDRVSYKGEGYVMLKEIGPDPVSPDKKKDGYWWRYPLRAEAISKAYSMPSDADTLTKKAFLELMISEKLERIYPWHPSTTYYANDLVMFEKHVYEALQDMEPGKKLTDKDYWELSYRFHRFFTLKDLNGITVLNHFSGDTQNKCIPQMISIRGYDHNAGFAYKAVLNFRYCDVVSFLHTIPQPLLYVTTAGYIGRSKFVLDQKSKLDLLALIRSAVIEKRLNTNDITIINHPSFQELLATTLQEDTEYHVTQEIGSNDLVITRRNQYVVRLPVKTFLIANPISDPVLFRYSDALRYNMFVRRIDTLSIDSLQSLPACSADIQQKPGESSWLEEFALSPQRQDESDLIRDAWNIIVGDARGKKIAAASEQRSNQLFFDWAPYYADTVVLPREHFNWREVFNTEDDWTYSLTSEFCDTISFKGLSMTYRRYLVKDHAVFTPITIRAIGQCGDTEVSSAFAWETIKDRLLKHDTRKFKKLIERIEVGKFPLGSARLISGLAEFKE